MSAENPQSVYENPAITQHTTLSPVRLEELVEDPRELAKHYRKRELIMASHLYDMLASPSYSITQKLEFLALMGKIQERLQPKAEKTAAPGQGFGINFIFNGTKDTLPAVEMVGGPAQPKSPE